MVAQCPGPKIPLAILRNGTIMLVIAGAPTVRHLRCGETRGQATVSEGAVLNHGHTKPTCILEGSGDLISRL